MVLVILWISQAVAPVENGQTAETTDCQGKSASKETTDTYFMELETVLRENHLMNEPERI